MRRKADPVLGAIAGLAMAVLTSLVAAGIYVIRGPAVFERLDISLGSALGLYLAAGIVGGVVVGLLLPLTVWRIGAVFVGMVAAAPLYLGVGLVIGETDIVAGVIAAVLVGGTVGYGLWSPAAPNSSGAGSSGT